MPLTSASYWIFVLLALMESRWIAQGMDRYELPLPDVWSTRQVDRFRVKDCRIWDDLPAEKMVRATNFFGFNLCMISVVVGRQPTSRSQQLIYVPSRVVSKCG